MFGKGKKAAAAAEPNPAFKVEFGEETDGLLKKHGEVIDPILKEFQGEFEEAAKVDSTLVFDELFVLRYVIASEGDIDKVKTNIKSALKWRADHADLLKSLKETEDGRGWNFTGTDEQNKDFEFMAANVCSGYLSGFGDLKHPVSLVRPGFTEQAKCMKSVKPENIVLYTTLQSEGLFRLCDAKTRETGRLVMSVQIVDFSSYSLMGRKSNRKMFGVVAQSSDESQFLHPLVRNGSFTVNMSSTMSTMKGMFGKKTANVTTCSNAKKLLADPFIAQHKIAEVLPDFLGGSGPTPEFFKTFK